MSDAWIKKLLRAAVRWCHRAASPARGAPTALDALQAPLCPRESPFGDNSFLSSTLLRNSQHSKAIDECIWQSTSNQGICSLLSKAACQWFQSERLMVQVIRTVMDISNEQYRFLPFFHSWMCNNLCCRLGEVCTSLVCFVKTASAWKKLTRYT